MRCRPRWAAVNSATATAMVMLVGVVAAPAGGMARQAAPRTDAHAGTSRPAHHGGQVPQLRHRGRFLVDPAGRVVIVHGINAVFKHAPYVAPKSAAGFRARDAKFLAANGINAVRLGVLFAGVMPHPGVVDHHYLSRINRIVRLLAARKIWVLLDFHQDAFNEKFAGEGFPRWAVHDDGLPFHDLGSFFVNDQQPAVERSYDHVWNDTNRLWHYYSKAWVAVAKKWRHQPYLMGYDLFNEPNAGTQMASCANPTGCPAFDATLQRFYDHVRRAIRGVDHRNLVWYEPQFLFNAISASNFTHVHDRQVALSWHDYACTPAFVSGGIIPGNPDCTVNEPRVMDNADRQMASMGAGGLMTEFGAEDDVTDLARITRYADQHLTGWMYWAYKLWHDPTGSSQEGLFRKDGRLSTVKRAKLDVLVHPYPQAIAGIPTAISWKAAGRILTVGYRPKRGEGRTVVFVPTGTYPHGFEVHVSGGKPHLDGQHSRQVRIRAGRHSTHVRVVIRPRNAG